jgi:hypothetical protein
MIKKFNIYLYKKYLFFCIFFFLFFSNYFFLGTAIPAYILAILLILASVKFIKFNLNQIIIILFLLLYFFTLTIIDNNTVVLFKHIKYYFGFFIFIILFKINNFLLQINIKYLRIIFLFIIFESIFINFFIDSKELYVISHSAIFLDFYERPSSFGGVSSITSSLIVCFFYFFEKHFGFKYKSFDFLLLIFSVILLFSLTGFFMMVLMFIFRFFSLKKFYIKDLIFLFFFIFCILILIGLSSLISPNIDQDGIYVNYEKISLEYFFNVVDDKFKQLLYHFSSFNFFSFDTITGTASQLNLTITSGDFGILNLYHAMGLSGIVFFFLVIYIFKEENVSITLFLLIISSFHYPVIMSPIGQLFSAFVICFNKKKYRLRYSN